MWVHACSSALHRMCVCVYMLAFVHAYLSSPFCSPVLSTLSRSSARYKVWSTVMATAITEDADERGERGEDEEGVEDKESALLTLSPSTTRDSPTWATSRHGAPPEPTVEPIIRITVGKQRRQKQKEPRPTTCTRTHTQVAHTVWWLVASG